MTLRTPMAGSERGFGKSRPSQDGPKWKMEPRVYSFGELDLLVSRHCEVMTTGVV